MGKIHVYGYGTAPGEQIRPDGRFDLLMEHLPLVLANAERILSKKEYFFCVDTSLAFLSIAYGTGGPIPLGVLVQLWQAGELIKQCPECDGKLYVLGCGGSPLSGTHSWWGFCPECKKRIHRSNEGKFRDLYVPIQDLLWEYPNETTIEKGERKKFSWGKGLVGKETPDVVIKAAIEGIALEELIRILQTE